MAAIMPSWRMILPHSQRETIIQFFLFVIVLPRYLGFFPHHLGDRGSATFFAGSLAPGRSAPGKPAHACIADHPLALQVRLSPARSQLGGRGPGPAKSPIPDRITTARRPNRRSWLEDPWQHGRAKHPSTTRITFSPPDAICTNPHLQRSFPCDPRRSACRRPSS